MTPINPDDNTGDRRRIKVTCSRITANNETLALYREHIIEMTAQSDVIPTETDNPLLIGLDRQCQ